MLKLIILVKLEQKFWIILYLANLNLSVMIEHFPSDKVLHTPPPQYRGTSEDLSPSARTRPEKKTVPLESRRAPTSSSTGAQMQFLLHKGLNWFSSPVILNNFVVTFSDESRLFMRPSPKPTKQPNDWLMTCLKRKFPCKILQIFNKNPKLK